MRPLSPVLLGLTLAVVGCAPSDTDVLTTRRFDTRYEPILCRKLVTTPPAALRSDRHRSLPPGFLSEGWPSSWTKRI